MEWIAGSGRITLRLTKAHARQCSHSGDCQAEVVALLRLPYIRRQLGHIDAGLLRAELQEYGAWDAVELENHDANLERLVWIAAGDITDTR